MATKKKGKLLAIYSCGHFLCDLACAFLMFSLPYNSANEMFFAIILYNFFAFAGQMPTGLIADKLDRNALVCSAGLCVTSAAYFCFSVPILAAVVLGIGNCLFHVGGGVDVLHFDGKRQWMLGVFVSPGAIGLFVGTMLARHSSLGILPMASLVCAASIAVSLALHLLYSLWSPSGNPEISLISSGRVVPVAVLCLFTVVVLRSYVGVTLSMPWKTGWLLPLLSVLGLAFGKAAGGFLADRIGASRASVISLSLSAVFFLFAENAVCGLIAIFLFNMTMPITLFAIAGLFPQARGFAFGCLTFALFLGCVPDYLSIPVPHVGKMWFYAFEAFLSLVLLSLGLWACHKRRKEK